jgi:PhnB protein
MKELSMAHSKKTKKPAAKKKVAPIPRGYHTLTPYLVCRGAANAIDFYKKAFSAKERTRMLGPGGSVMHAELLIGESIMMLGDEMLETGATSPHTVGGTATGLFIYTANVDQAYAKAIAAGAKPEMPPMDMFWGDRYCKFVDPFGHKWSMATHLEDLTPKQMQKRGEAFMAQQAAAGAPKA